MFLNLCLLVFGFFLLIKGADLFVDGSSSVAKLLKVPTLIIGLTIVAMGTSAPECAVSVAASLKGENSLAISNVIGSNIFNLLVVCGCCAFIKPLEVKENLLKKEFPYSIFVGVILLIFVAFFPFKNYTVMRIEGVILLVLFILFILNTIRQSLNARNQNIVSEGMEEIKAMPLWKSLLFIIVGLIGIIFGGDLVVNSASYIASEFGFSQTFIGLTVVAVGTSLPELVTSFVASKKGENDMALGNVIGSNIFNITLIIGVASVISSISVTFESIMDLVLLMVMNVVVFFFCKSKREINKKEGISMILIYLIYMVYITMR